MQHYYSEPGYLELLESVLKSGVSKMERNGPTRKLIGQTLEFNLLDQFPLFISKKMFMHGIVAELEMFLNGICDIRFLWARGVHIWDLNWLQHGHENERIESYSRRELFELVSKMTKAELFAFVNTDLKYSNPAQFDLGPIYGAQWRGRHALRNRTLRSLWNAGNEDQLSNVVSSLRNGGSRRDILTANYDDFKDMSLPPCPLLYQFHREGDFVDLTVYQRSADMFLGVPFDVTSFALLLKIVCALTHQNLIARRIVVTFADTHIYENHIAAVEEQLKRTAEVNARYSEQYALPTISTSVQGVPTTVLGLMPLGAQCIDDIFIPAACADNEYSIFLYSFSTRITFTVNDYKPLPAIKAPIS